MKYLSSITLYYFLHQVHAELLMTIFVLFIWSAALLFLSTGIINKKESDKKIKELETENLDFRRRLGRG